MGEAALYKVEPYDTTVFRDGRPFEQDDLGLAETVAQFPPTPPTIVGALSVALAASLEIRPGIKGDSNWSAIVRKYEQSSEEAERKIAEALGKILAGPFAGPFLLQPRVGGGEELLVPAPADVLVDKDGLPIGRARPHSAPDRNMLPFEARSFDGEKLKDFDTHSGSWITWLNFLSFQNAPEKSDHEETHWASPRSAENNNYGFHPTVISEQAKISLEINPKTGAAETSRLFIVNHQRLLADRSLAVIGPAISTFPEIGMLIPLGGEGRFAHVTKTNLLSDEILKTNPRRATNESGRRKSSSARPHLKATALTPIRVSATNAHGLPESLQELLRSFEYVDMICKRPESVGYQVIEGSEARAHIDRFFPAGTVWFFKAKKPCGISELISEQRKTFGTQNSESLARFGFSTILFGAW